MNKIKVNLDRKPLSSDYIESKQDFKHVTNQVQASTAILKSTWFYGSIGLASLATIVTLSVKSTQNPLNEDTSTLKNNITTASFLAPTQQKTSRQKETKVTKLKPQVKAETKQIVPESKKVVKSVSIQNKEVIPVQEVRLNDVKERPEVIKQPVITPKKEPVKSYIPKINGVYNGEIAIQQLCGSGIEVNADVEVTSFTLNYSTNRGDKALRVTGNTVPIEVCREMYAYGIDQMIFIMDIVGKNSEGELLRFVPMNLTAVMNY